MRRSITFLLYASAFVAMAGCTWKAKVLDAENIFQLPEGTTGLLIPVEFESQHVVVGQEGCSLILKPQGGFNSYEIPFQYGDSQIFATLSPDVYYFEEVYCGKVHLDLMFQNIPMVMILKNKISVAVGMKFSASTYLDRNFFSLFDRARSQSETLRALKRLPLQAQSRAVSAYTGKTITLAGLDQASDSPSVEVLQGQPKRIELSSLIMKEVRDCQLVESKRNPLVLGNVVIEARYSQQALQNIEQLPSWNVLNPEFPKCLMTAVRKYQPEGGQDLKVKYTF